MAKAPKNQKFPDGAISIQLSGVSQQGSVCQFVGWALPTIYNLILFRARRQGAKQLIFQLLHLCVWREQISLQFTVVSLKDFADP
jgi:hypothetical protein